MKKRPAFAHFKKRKREREGDGERESCGANNVIKHYMVSFWYFIYLRGKARKWAEWMSELSRAAKLVANANPQNALSEMKFKAPFAAKVKAGQNFKILLQINFSLSPLAIHFRVFFCKASAIELASVNRCWNKKKPKIFKSCLSIRRSFFNRMFIFSH